MCVCGRNESRVISSVKSSMPSINQIGTLSPWKLANLVWSFQCGPCTYTDGMIYLLKTLYLIWDTFAFTFTCMGSMKCYWPPFTWSVPRLLSPFCCAIATKYFIGHPLPRMWYGCFVQWMLLRLVWGFQCEPFIYMGFWNVLLATLYLICDVVVLHSGSCWVSCEAFPYVHWCNEIFFVSFCSMNLVWCEPLHLITQMSSIQLLRLPLHLLCHHLTSESHMSEAPGSAQKSQRDGACVLWTTMIEHCWLRTSLRFSRMPLDLKVTRNILHK